jgi:hypothetical protein
MAPDPAWAETVRAAAVQRGSCAAETGGVETVVLGAVAADVGAADVVAAVVGRGPTDDRAADVGRLDGTVRDGTVGADATVVAAAARVVAVVVATEADGLWSDADRFELQALTSTAIATRPSAAPMVPRRGEDETPAEPRGGSEPPGIS